MKRRYFREDGYWTFYGKDAELIRPDATPITRLVKVTGRHSPYNPALRAYWQERTKRVVARQTYVKRKLALLTRQEGRCAVCAILFATTEEVHIHHRISRRAGGMDDLTNLQAVHPWCHQQHHQRCGYKVLKA